MNGYVGGVLRVDLAERRSSVEALNVHHASRYLGAGGLGARMIIDELGAGTDPLGPANKIILATGPLTGTSCPGSAKYALVTKSPATGLFLDSYAGGQFGPELKYAGFDAMIVEGRSERPVFLYVNDGEVEFRDASRLWGADCHEAEDAIKEEVGRDARVLVIGPAGENLVRMACVNTEYYRHHGRGGAGAVFGSKNLKGIAVKGTGGVTVADPGRFRELVGLATEEAMRSPDGLFAISWQGGGGTAEIVDWSSEWGGLPTRNFTAGVFEAKDSINAKAAAPYRAGVQACAACPAACGHFAVVEGGPHAGARVEGPEYESIALLGSNCGVGDLPGVIRANELCDKLGLDTISAGNVVAWAMECRERGLISDEDAGGPGLRFGDVASQLRLLELVARRQGIGALLADGVAVAAERLGKGSKAFAMHVKGLELPGYEPRAAQSMGLAYATSNRGACHLRAWPIGAELWGSYWLGSEPVELSRDTPYGKAGLVAAQQHYQLYRFSATTCDFIFMDIERLAELVTAATGIEELADWRLVGERAFNASRLFNLREGMRREDEALPERLHSDPLVGGEAAGRTLPREDLAFMLEDYYRLRGYDDEGRPTGRRLEEIGMGDLAGLARDLAKGGRR